MDTTGTNYIKQMNSLSQGHMLHVISPLWMLEFIYAQNDIFTSDMKVEVKLSGEQRGLSRGGNRWARGGVMKRYVENTLCTHATRVFCNIIGYVMMMMMVGLRIYITGKILV